MAKKLTLIIFGTFMALILLIFLKFKDTPTQTVPYPYVFNKKSLPASQDYEQAHILVAGDDLALLIGKQQDELNNKLSHKLKEPLFIKNWGHRQEGLHRSLAKLKSLKNLPKVLIYAGGGSEFIEKKFELGELAKIEQNLKRYDNEKLLSIILTFPFLSRLFYTPVERVNLTDTIKEDRKAYHDNERQKILEFQFKLFKLNLKELIKWTQKNNIHLILITPAVNLEAAPKKACSNSQTNTLLIEQNEIKKLLQKEQIKEAYKRIKELLRVSLGNADTYHLLGLAAKKLGRFEEAKEAFTNASALDCAPQGAHPVINAIMKKMAQQYSRPLIDFDKLVNQNLGRNILFLNEEGPQALYQEQLINEILKELREYFNL